MQYPSNLDNAIRLAIDETYPARRSESKLDSDQKRLSPFRLKTGTKKDEGISHPPATMQTSSFVEAALLTIPGFKWKTTFLKIGCIPA
jgi:hypothetical protein